MNKDKQTLELAIQKAIEGGWNPMWKGEYMGNTTDTTTGEIYTMWSYVNAPYPFKISLAFLFLDKGFAKALWGDFNTDYRLYNMDTPIDPHLLIWKYHLQQMVISPDPILYLKEHM